MNSQVVKSACRMCRRSCGIDIHVTDGRIIKVKGSSENPASGGMLCPKGRAVIDYIYSPSRIKHPLQNMNGKWQSIKWDEAIDIIAKKLKKLKQDYGANALAVFMGESASQCDSVSYVRRFLDLYGSPNMFTGGSLCFRPIPIACRLTFGRPFVPEAENSKCIILWGINPDSSNRQQSAHIVKARNAGAKLIVIDPRKTFFARKADIHIQPEPGTDCILALGIMNVIISQKLYDKEFVQKWTSGFEKLEKYIADFTPGKVEKATRVPAKIIEESARMFANNKPAAIFPGAALFHQTCAVQNLRAVSILQAITGNIDVPGGWIASTGLSLKDTALPEKMKERPLGEDKYPLFIAFSPRLEGQAAALMDTLITGKPYPVKAMFIAGGNPALSWPNSTKVIEALKKLGFLVVMDTTMTKTAELADIVLPAATFAETTELHTYIEAGIPYSILRKKAVDYPECWTDSKLWLQLAKKMGYQDYFPWDNEEEAIDFLLEPSGLTIDSFKKNPAGVFYGEKQYGICKQKGFPTPSGKVELYSSKLEEMGHSPLPAPDNYKKTNQEYPLLLITGARQIEFTHSQFRYIQSLHQGIGEPAAEINPKTAEKYGISRNGMVYIETVQGILKIKAKITEDILPDVISTPLGWAEANTNVLTDWQNSDVISGLPVLVGLPCRIKSAQ